MTPQQPTPDSTRATVCSFEIKSRHYEARMNDCGKTNCNKCGGTGTRKPSHGPYWYLCVMSRGSWRRIYLGKECDTSRFITPEGYIDWPAVKAKRRKKTLIEVTNKDTPGQTTIFDKVPDVLVDSADRTVAS